MDGWISFGEVFLTSRTVLSASTRVLGNATWPRNALPSVRFSFVSSIDDIFAGAIYCSSAPSTIDEQRSEAP